MNAILAVLCLAVAAHAAELPSEITEMIGQKGKQYELYKKLTGSVTLKGDPKKDTMKGLNIHRADEQIDEKDLNLWFYHEDLKFAKKKFLNQVEDQSSKDGKVKESELADDLKQKAIILALAECQYLLSPGLRQACYADQLLTYTTLCLQQDDVDDLYAHIDKDGKNNISADEVSKLPKPKDSMDLDIVAEELGANDDKGCTKDELKDYVLQDTVNDDFRICRKGPPNEQDGDVDFKNDCLVSELIEYANDDLTDLDVAVLFRALDTNKNNKITKNEISPIVGADKADKVMELLDMSATTPSGAGEIDFGEFRTYARSPTVMMQLERGCTEPEKTQLAEMKCLYKTFVKLCKEGHDPIWLFVPDLDQIAAFETFDKDNDGDIEVDELQSFDKFKHAKAAARMISECDADESKKICLEEFNEYLDIPHMVYGTADCLLKSRADGATRGKCFVDETGDTVDNFKFIEDGAWASWFSYYDDKGDGYIDAGDTLNSKFGDSKDLATLFLLELGQGGDTVNPFEFRWYVKQQELADRYEEDGIVTDTVSKFDNDQLGKLHEKLKKYIEDDLTEYDVEGFFSKLDKKKDHELTAEDFGDAWPQVKPLIEAIDQVEPQSDADKTVNFREFWLWLNSPDKKKSGKLIKDIFETECTEKHNSQRQEIDCYVEKFKEVNKFLG